MYLRCITGDRPRQWPHWLSWAEYCYNTAFHSSRTTPFNVVYGRDPPALLQYIPGARLPAVHQQLQDRDEFVLQASGSGAPGAGPAAVQGALRSQSPRCAVHSRRVGLTSFLAPAVSFTRHQRQGQAGTQVFWAIQGVGQGGRRRVSAGASRRHQAARRLPCGSTEAVPGGAALGTRGVLDF
jgi:hypothetical protein